MDMGSSSLIWFSSNFVEAGIRMKVEFLDNIDDGGRFSDVDPRQLVRLYDFDRAEVNSLRQILQELIARNVGEVELTALDFVQPVNCKLKLRVSNNDLGITASGNTMFVCDVTILKYTQMISLIEPFCDNDVNGYQWLYDIDTPIDFLFSSDGSW